MPSRRSTIKFEGVEEMQRKLAANIVAVSGVLEHACKTGAEMIEEEAKPNAPRLSGALAASFFTATKFKSRTKVVVGFGVSAKSKKGYLYALGLEWGTKKLKAKPFLRPAFDKKKLTVRDEIRGQIRDSISF